MPVYSVENYDGWLYDEEMDFFLSPSGRIADKPGGRFFGQVSADSYHEYLKQLEADTEVVYDKTNNSVEHTDYKEDGMTEQEAEDFALDAEQHLEPDEEIEEDGVHARTWRVGNITVNIVDIV